MNKDTVDLILACIGITIGLCTLMGFFGHLVLLPWLKRELVAPVKETNHQVTVNRHVSPEPTLLDKVDNLQKDITTAAHMFEGHIERSGSEWNRLWRAIHEIDERTRPAHRKDPHRP